MGQGSQTCANLRRHRDAGARDLRLGSRTMAALIRHILHNLAEVTPYAAATAK